MPVQFKLDAIAEIPCFVNVTVPRQTDRQNQTKL